MALAFSLLVLLAAAPQEKYTLAAQAREIPPDPAAQRKPGLLVEGTTNLPAGSRLTLRLFYGEVFLGRDLRHATVLPADGKFAHTFEIFPEKNLAGVYTIEVVFSPNQQVQAIRHAMGEHFRKYEVAFKLEIGTPEEMERDRARVVERVAGQIQEFLALADEVEARYAEGKLDAKGWERLRDDLLKRGLGIEKRAVYVPEYRALHFEDITSDGFESLRDSVLKVANTAAGASLNPKDPYGPAAVKATRQSLNATANGYLRRLNFDPVKERRKMIASAEDARRILRDTLEGRAASVSDARKKFNQAILILGNGNTGSQYGQIYSVATEAAAFFEAAAEKAAGAGKLHAELDRKLGEILAALRQDPQK